MKKVTVFFLIFSFVLISKVYADPNGVPGHVSHERNVITVTTHSDVVANDGRCSLREAVEAANANTRSGEKAGECDAGKDGLDVIRVYQPSENGSVAELLKEEQGKNYELTIDEKNDEDLLVISEDLMITGGDVDEDAVSNFATIDIGEATFPFRIKDGSVLILKNVKIITAKEDK